LLTEPLASSRSAVVEPVRPSRSPSRSLLPFQLAHYSSFCVNILQGVETVISVPRDFTLTNAALGEDLADASGRSVLKLTHEVIPAKRFQDGGYISGEESEEEDEEEEDDDVEMTTIVVTSLTAGKVSSQTKHDEGGGLRFRELES
jgi:hypothetical protein